MLECVFTWSLWLAVALASGASAALLVGGSRARSGAAIALGALGLGLPFVAPDSPPLRAALSLYASWSFINVIELARDPVPRSAGFRLLQVLVLHDLRLDAASSRRHGSELRPGLLLSSALAAGITALGLWAVASAGPPRAGDAGTWLVRYGAGVLVTYAAVETVVRFLSFGYRALGLRPPRLHDHPILARSVAEFWGRRWNRIVGAWLRSVGYSPLAARGSPRLGIALTFVLSALLHLYFAWAAAGLGLALVMASFFVLQIPLVALERALGPRRWRPRWQRLWTLGVLGLLSPLFVEPFLHIVEGAWCPGSAASSFVAPAGRRGACPSLTASRKLPALPDRETAHATRRAAQNEAR